MIFIMFLMIETCKKIHITSLREYEKSGEKVIDDITTFSDTHYVG